MGFKFKCLIRFDIGNGSTVRFWHDLWQVRSPSRRGILRCSLLSEVVMLQWLIILSVGMVRCIGFFSFFVQCRIGK